MMVMKNKDGTIRYLYTGREFIAAIGKKYDLLHEKFENKYDQYFEFFDNSEDSLDHIPIFENKDEFEQILTIAEKEMDLSSMINEELEKKENIIHNISKITIKNSHDLKKIIKSYRRFKSGIFTTIITIILFVAICVILYIK